MMGRAGRLLEVSSGPAEDQGFLTKEPRLSFLPLAVSLHQEGKSGVFVCQRFNACVCGHVCVCRCVRPKGRSPGGLTP